MDSFNIINPNNKKERSEVSKTNNDFKEGDEIFQVSFEIPRKLHTDEIIAKTLIKIFNDISNIKAIPCKVIKESEHLIMDRDDYSYMTFNSKHLKIIKPNILTSVRSPQPSCGTRLKRIR